MPSPLCCVIVRKIDSFFGEGWEPDSGVGSQEQCRFFHQLTKAMTPYFFNENIEMGIFLASEPEMQCAQGWRIRRPEGQRRGGGEVHNEALTSLPLKRQISGGTLWLEATSRLRVNEINKTKNQK